MRCFELARRPGLIWTLALTLLAAPALAQDAFDLPNTATTLNVLSEQFAADPIAVPPIMDSTNLTVNIVVRPAALVFVDGFEASP